MDTLTEIEMPEVLVKALGKTPVATYKGKTDFMLLFEKQQDVEGLSPDFRLIESAGGRGVIVTAAGSEVDFVSRFFVLR